MSDTSASSKPTPSIVSRVVLQQCLSARLQLNHPDDALIVEGEEEPVYATVGKGQSGGFNSLPDQRQRFVEVFQFRTTFSQMCISGGSIAFQLSPKLPKLFLIRSKIFTICSVVMPE